MKNQETSTPTLRCIAPTPGASLDWLERIIHARTASNVTVTAAGDGRVTLTHDLPPKLSALVPSIVLVAREHLDPSVVIEVAA